MVSMVGPIVTLIISLVILLCVGWYSFKKKQSESMEDYFLASRTVGPMVVALSLFATQYSGNSMIGYTARAYRIGFQQLVFPIFMVMIPVAYMLFIPRLYVLAHKRKYMTLLDFLEDRFRSKTLCLIAGIFLFWGIYVQFLEQLQASGTLFAGLGPHIIGNPFGGALSLDSLTFSFPGIGEIIFFADLLVFFWVFLLMSTTKFLDGLDGLAAGTVFIGALVLFFLSLQGQWFQPEISYLSIVFSGALFGFLLLNFHPAKIFLGEGGSLFIGFLLACLATLAGGKIAVTFLLLGVPFLDIVRVMLKRIQKGQPIFVGDREHLHLLLVDSGLGHRQTVLFFYGISLLFGFSILFFQSSDHIFAFILILLLILFISVWFSKK